jgi:hypothetical protein
MMLRPDPVLGMLVVQARQLARDLAAGVPNPPSSPLRDFAALTLRLYWMRAASRHGISGTAALLEETVRDRRRFVDELGVPVASLVELAIFDLFQAATGYCPACGIVLPHDGLCPGATAGQPASDSAADGGGDAG